MDRMEKVAVGVIVVGVALWFGVGSMNKTVPTIDTIYFDHPQELRFERVSDSEINIDLASSQEDKLQFHGKVELLPTYARAWTSLNTVNYVKTSDPNQPHRVNKSDSFESLAFFNKLRTKAGDDLVTMGYGDAGSLVEQYLVRLTNGNVVIFTKSTYEDPSIWGTDEDARLTEHQLLNSLFEKMVQSVKLLN